MHTAQLMPLPLTVSCFSKIQIGFTFLVPAHLGSLRRRAIKQVCVCVYDKQNKNMIQRSMPTSLTVSAAILLLLLILHPFNSLFSRTTWVSRYQNGKTSLDLNEARYDGVFGCNNISWTICKQSSPHSRQIITPTPHQSIFTGRMLFLTPNQQCQCIESRL